MYTGFHTLPNTAPVLLLKGMVGCSVDCIGNGDIIHVIVTATWSI
jgi:hypothetical protein